MGTGRRRWTINGDFVGLAPTGVARYAKEVTSALDQLMVEHHPLTRDLDLDLVAPRDPDQDFDAIPVRVVEERKPRLPQVWVQLQLPRAVEGGLLSFCNLAPIRAERHIACIHDLQTRTNPGSYGRAFRWAHHLILPRLGRKADRITTVSSLSRDHLIHYGIAEPERIAVTFNGSDHALRWRPGHAQQPWSRPRPFVLGIARDQPHKNAALFWRIAAGLDALGIDIVLVGDVNPAIVAPFSPSLPGNVMLMGRVADDDLAAGLSQALCFLFPSRAEGFGLPAVEAMAWGCPVITSNAPCLPEICGDAALYADPDSPKAWIAAVARLAGNPALRSALIDAGRSRARKFSWASIAEHYLELMADVDRERSAETEAVRSLTA